MFSTSANKTFIQCLQYKHKPGVYLNRHWRIYYKVIYITIKRIFKNLKDTRMNSRKYHQYVRVSSNLPLITKPFNNHMQIKMTDIHKKVIKTSLSSSSLIRRTWLWQSLNHFQKILNSGVPGSQFKP